MTFHGHIFQNLAEIIQVVVSRAWDMFIVGDTAIYIIWYITGTFHIMILI